MDVLKTMEAVKQLATILKTNVRACKALGHAYVLQLGRIYLDMLNVYKVSYSVLFCATIVNLDAMMHYFCLVRMKFL